MLDRLSSKATKGLTAYQLGLAELANTTVQKSVVQAGNKAAGKTNTFAKRTVAKAMGVSQKFIKERVKAAKPFEVVRAKSSGKVPLAGAKIKVVVRGRPIRLIYFSAKEKVTKRGGRQGVVTKVWGTRRTLDDAFVTTVRYKGADDAGGEVDGVFVRKGSKRYPIKQLYGPGPAREAERNEKPIMAEFAKAMGDILPKQLEFNISKAMAREPLRRG